MVALSFDTSFVPIAVLVLCEKALYIADNGGQKVSKRLRGTFLGMGTTVILLAGISVIVKIRLKMCYWGARENPIVLLDYYYVISSSFLNSYEYS